MPINKCQVLNFPDYDNTELFIKLLELLAPKGFTDDSGGNDACPSLSNDKFGICVTYTADSEHNEFKAFYIGVGHRGEDEGEGEDFQTVDEVMKYLEDKNV